MNELLQQIHRIGVVPVIKITDPETAVPLARALDKGGIPVAEVTFRTQHAAEAIRRISAEVPQVLTGAGTVTTTEQVDTAVAAGAKFIVTPGFNPKVVDYCLERNIPKMKSDLLRYGMSGGEFDSVLRAVGGIDRLIDWEQKAPEIDLMRYMDDKTAKEDKVFDNPKLMKTPVVRNGKQATVGYCPEIWGKWE